MAHIGHNTPDNGIYEIILIDGESFTGPTVFDLVSSGNLGGSATLEITDASSAVLFTLTNTPVQRTPAGTLTRFPVDLALLPAGPIHLRVTAPYTTTKGVASISTSVADVTNVAPPTPVPQPVVSLEVDQIVVLDKVAMQALLDSDTADERKVYLVPVAE